MIVLRPATLKDANALVSQWHRHHSMVPGHRLACIAAIAGVDVGAVIVGRPCAMALATNPRIGEVTRLVCRGGDANVGTRLLGAAWRAWKALGGTRLVSYVRVDEYAGVYRAAGWQHVADLPARNWLEERHLVLPGILAPASEPVARARWEMLVR